MSRTVETRCAFIFHPGTHDKTEAFFGGSEGGFRMEERKGR